MVLVCSSLLQPAENPQITLEQSSQATLTATLPQCGEKLPTGGFEAWWLFNETKVIKPIFLPVCPVRDTAVCGFYQRDVLRACAWNAATHNDNRVRPSRSISWVHEKYLCPFSEVVKSAKHLCPLCPARLWNNGVGCLCRMQRRHGAPAWQALLTWV